MFTNPGSPVGNAPTEKEENAARIQGSPSLPQSRKEEKAAKRRERLVKKQQREAKKLNGIGITPSAPRKSTSASPDLDQAGQDRPSEIDPQGPRLVRQCDRLDTSKSQTDQIHRSPLDLHGLTVREGLQQVVHQYNNAYDKHGSGCVELLIVHGYSTSYDQSAVTIKNCLHALCIMYAEHMTHCNWENPGMKLIIPMKRLPGFSESLYLKLIARIKRSKCGEGG